MNAPYTHFLDIASQAEPPEDGILSRTLFEDERIKVVIFGFGAGQELSEHTASKPALLHLLRGEVTLTLGGDVLEAHPGTWVHMPAQLSHAVRATTPAVLLLVLLRA